MALLDRLTPYFKTFLLVLAFVGLLGFAAYKANAQSTVTVSLSATPSTGNEIVSPTLTWSSTGAASCEASGGWSGSKATSGSETVPQIMVDTTYTLTCASGGGSATLTWTPPTQYTNGQPIAATGLEALAGYKAFYGPRGNVTANMMNLPDPSLRSAEVSGLGIAEYEFAMTAYLGNGAESQLSASAFKVVTGASKSVSASVNVNPVPKPPVLVTVETLVYDVRITPQGESVLWRTVGTVPLGTECQGEPLVAAGGGLYYDVSLDQVALTKMPKTLVVVARCEAIQG